MKAFFRQVVAPILIVLVFLVALAATSARIFLPNDMVTPAPGGMVPSISLMVAHTPPYSISSAG